MVSDIQTDRDMLLDVARSILETQGPGGLNVRSIAKSAGVSTMAIYSRFGGKDGVVDALYAEGFSLLAGAQEAALGGAAASAGDRVLTMCLVYRDIALAHRGHYQIMTTPPSGFQPSGGGRTAARRTFDLLTEAVAACRGMRKKDARDFAYGLFGLCHGIVSLEILGFAELTPNPSVAYKAAVKRAIAELDGGKA